MQNPTGAPVTTSLRRSHFYRYLTYSPKLSKKALLAVSLTAGLLAQGIRSEAQELKFTKTPGSGATEGVLYSDSIAAIIDNGSSVYFSGMEMPQWLSLTPIKNQVPFRTANLDIKMNGPIAHDGHGNSYVVSRTGATRKIYKIERSGIIKLFSEVTNPANSNNDAAIVVGDYLYVTNMKEGILRYDLSDGNAAPVLVYDNPTFIFGLAHKDGFLYFSLFSSGKIGRIKVSNNIYSDYITSGVGNCGGIAFSPSGELYIAINSSSGKVLKHSGGVLSTAIPGLTSPENIIFDQQGNLYVDMWANPTRKYKPDFSSFVPASGDVVTVAGMSTGNGTMMFTDGSNGNVYTLMSAARISGTPSAIDVGDHLVHVNATAGELYDEYVYIVHVNDPNPPTVESYFPAGNAIGVSSKPTLKLFFTENIKKGAGKIYVKSSLDNEIYESIDVTSSNVSIDGGELRITLQNSLPAEAKIYVTIDNEAISDLSGNYYAGISDSEVWHFKTAAPAKIVFTSDPVTTTPEKKPYSAPVSATINNEDELTYSAVQLPEWLKLEVSGGVSFEKLNATSIPAASAIAQDANGNYYVIGSEPKIYKIAPDGKITVYTTFEDEAVSYDAVVVENFLYVAFHSGNFRGIKKYDLGIPNHAGVAVRSVGGQLASVAYKSGYIYGTDYFNGKVIRINLATNGFEDYLSTTSPWGIAVGNSGELFITHPTTNKISKYSGGSRVDISTGSANPRDILVDAEGYVYVSFTTAQVRKYKPDLSSYEDVSGGHIGYGINLDSKGNLYFASRIYNSVYATKKGNFLTGTPSHKDVGDHLVKLKATNGTISEEQEFTITVTDPNPPQVEGYSPYRNAQNIALDTTIKITFDENIAKGSGKLYIQSKANNQVLQTIDVNDQNVTVDGYTLIVKLAKKMPPQTDIYVTIESGAIKDLHDNAFAGIESSTAWYFRTVEKLEQSIAFNATRTVTYGDVNVMPGASSDAGLDVSYSSSDESIAVVANGEIQIKKAGKVIITAKQQGNDDYSEAEPVKQTLTIQPKEITANVADVPFKLTKIYDGSRPIEIAKEYFKINGTVEGDDVYVISGYSAFENRNAGENKTINIDDLTLAGEDRDNYYLGTSTLTTTGTILPKDVTVKFKATPLLTRIYDGTTDASMKGMEQMVFGLVGEDEVTVRGTIAFADKHVGEKTVTISKLVTEGESKDNYNLVTGSYDLPGKILPRPVVISANDHTKVYGTTDPKFGYKIDDLVKGDVVKGSLVREEGKDVGEYRIGIGTLSLGNDYAVEDFKTGVLKITPAELVITAEDKTKKQGSANPALTVSYKGLAEGDKPADLLSAAVITTRAITTSAIGDYEIIVSGATSENYTIRFVSGRLSVMPENNSHIKVWASSPSEIQVRIYSEVPQKAAIILYTEIGQPVVVQPKQLNAGFNTVSVSVGHLSPSMYVLNVKADKFNEAQRVKVK